MSANPALAAGWLLPVVAETWDGYLNDINGAHVTPQSKARVVKGCGLLSRLSAGWADQHADRTPGMTGSPPRSSGRGVWLPLVVPSRRWLLPSLTGHGYCLGGRPGHMAGLVPVASFDLADAVLAGTGRASGGGPRRGGGGGVVKDPCYFRRILAREMRLPIRQNPVAGLDSPPPGGGV